MEKTMTNHAVEDRPVTFRPDLPRVSDSESNPQVTVCVVVLPQPVADVAVDPGTDGDNLADATWEDAELC
jgi:hypothetical protein